MKFETNQYTKETNIRMSLITLKDVETFNRLLTAKAKEILKDPETKGLLERNKVCSVYLEDGGVGVQILITIPKK